MLRSPQLPCPFVLLPRWFALGLILSCAGCGREAAPDQAMRQYVETLHQIHRLLETVHDEASYLRAKPELSRLWRRSEQLHSRFGTRYSLQDVSAHWKEESEAVDEAISRELERIAATHREVARQIVQLNQTIQDEVLLELD